MVDLRLRLYTGWELPSTPPLLRPLGEMVDTLDLGSSALGHTGSSPVGGTMQDLGISQPGHYGPKLRKGTQSHKLRVGQVG